MRHAVAFLRRSRRREGLRYKQSVNILDIAPAAQQSGAAKIQSHFTGLAEHAPALALFGYSRDRVPSDAPR
jgi:hypothetical protein